MVELAVNNLLKYYGAYKVFENVNFELKTRERVGLLGRNGVGKTTIMKILIGAEDYDGGNISIKKGNKIGYLDQIPDYPDEYKVIDVLQLAFKKIYSIRDRMREVESKLSMDSSECDSLLKTYGKLQQDYELAGGYDIEEKLSKIIQGLNISEQMQQMSFCNLSGGEKSRIVLGKILLENPEILLLDEPSNHLDLKSIEWLENYLKDYEGSVLIISHDRYFLDKAINKVIELDTDGIETYHGNYSHYLVEKKVRYDLKMKHYILQQNKIERMEEQIKRFRIWGMYVKAKEREKKLSKIDRLKKPTLDAKIKIRYDDVARSSNEVLIIQGLEKSFGDRLLFSNLDLKVMYGDKLTILGDNGVGKSTLIKIIMDEIKADRGKVKLGSRISIGYLPQEVSFDNVDYSILEEFQRKYNIPNGEARDELAKVLFTDEDVYKKISTLSGGEKSRLKLCMLMYEKINFMILDEPTNHLDIDSKEILEYSLKKFEGTALIVSHDRYFINKISTKIAEIDDRKLKVYKGNYEYYKDELEKLEQCNSDSKVIKNKKNKPYKDKPVKSNKKLNETLASIEVQIESLEATIQDIENQMNKHANNSDKLMELNKELEENKTDLDILLDQWSDISTELEEVKIKD